MSNFMFLFSDYLLSLNYNVKLVLFSNDDCKINFKLNLKYDHIYINGHFSNIDKFYIKNGKMGLEKLLNLNLKYSKIIILSHGWNKFRFSFHLYFLYYFIKSLNSNLNRIYKYDSITFINDSIDNYRHLDFKFVINNKIKYSYFNFANFYIQNLRKISKQNIYVKNKKITILIISNPDFVKNLEILILLSIKNLIKKNKRQYNLLTIKPNNLYFKILYFFLKLLKINLHYNQNDKFSLLNECSYLLIPSHTEYLPLVALEALSFNKHVVSFNKFTSLINFNFYHSLTK